MKQVNEKVNLPPTCPATSSTAVNRDTADRRSSLRRWLLVLSLVVFMAVLFACAGSNESSSSSSSTDTTVGSGTTSPSLIGADVGSYQ